MEKNKQKLNLAQQNENYARLVNFARNKLQSFLSITDFLVNSGWSVKVLISVMMKNTGPVRYVEFTYTQYRTYPVLSV